MKIIFSTGHGRLHIIQSAVSLKKAGYKVTVITGWVPRKFISDKWINRLGKMVGRGNNLAAGLKKRTPADLSREEIKSCGFSEFFVQFLFKLSSFHIMKRVVGAVWGWSMFGRESRRYITQGDIFHVRSGGGRGGAIKKARKKGMRIVVDHSISHPVEMEKQLLKSAGTGKIKHNYYLGTWPTDKFWDTVVEDCDEADMLVVNSEYVKWSFVNEGYNAENIRVVQLGVGKEFGSVKKTDYAISGAVRLAFSGGFGSRKGAAVIIEALEKLNRLNIPFTFHVVGTVMGDIQVPEWMKRSPNITFHGHLPQAEMIPIIRDSDIYVFPTYSEGSAQSVKEAMALGLPVITTRQCGSPITNFTNGILIEDGNADAIAEAVIALKDNETFRQQIGANAAKLISEEHTWERYAKCMAEVYLEVLNK